ncbi:MAG TPA: recombination mediator RecR [Nitrospiria bacterium]|nr:recombination mediator RecR [Nitrospiria bacterium]
MKVMSQNPLDRLIEELRKLPGIGRKTAQRLAFFLLKMPAEEAHGLAQAVLDVKERLRFCRWCNNISEAEVCRFCTDSLRDRTRILVVEEASTLFAIERTGEYKGLYHVLVGSLSPLDGRGPAEIKAQSLLDRLKLGETKEVIIATNPTIEGEATAIYLTRLIKPTGVKVTRIAYGIPVGVDLEYADEVTLIKSLEGRRELA